jgi:hypothetical protein
MCVVQYLYMPPRRKKFERLWSFPFAFVLIPTYTFKIRKCIGRANQWCSVCQANDFSDAVRTPHEVVGKVWRNVVQYVRTYHTQCIYLHVYPYITRIIVCVQYIYFYVLYSTLLRTYGTTLPVRCTTLYDTVYTYSMLLY